MAHTICVERFYCFKKDLTFIFYLLLLQLVLYHVAALEVSPFNIPVNIIVILVNSKNEEDPIKIEGASVPTTQNIDFSDTQGQLTPQS